MATCMHKLEADMSESGNYTYCAHGCANNQQTLPVGIGVAVISLLLAINEIITNFSFGKLRKLVATCGLSDYFDVIVKCLLEEENKDYIKPFDVGVLSWKMTSAIEQYMESTSVPLIKV